jgi:DNA-binding GntR family transcriptional regulator
MTSSINTELSLVKHQSLTDLIGREIENLIFTGKLNAGDRINEKQLADQLGVSRAPIREATRALQPLGLVEIIKNRGVFVRSVNLKQVVDIFNIRVRLAGLAASQAARHMNEAAENALSDLMDQMDVTRDAEQYLELNLEYHRQIFNLSGNERLAALDTSLGKEIRLFRARGLRAGGGLLISNQEHRGISAALSDRNPELAGRLFEQHVLAGRDRFLSTIDKQDPAAVLPRRRGRPRKVEA